MSRLYGRKIEFRAYPRTAKRGNEEVKTALPSVPSADGRVQVDRRTNVKGKRGKRNQKRERLRGCSVTLHDLIRK